MAIRSESAGSSALVSDSTTQTGPTLAQIFLRRGERAFLIDVPNGTGLRLSRCQVLTSSVYPLLSADDRAQIEAQVRRWTCMDKEAGNV